MMKTFKQFYISEELSSSEELQEALKLVEQIDSKIFFGIFSSLSNLNVIINYFNYTILFDLLIYLNELSFRKNFS